MSESYSFHLPKIKPHESGWQNYVLGVIAGFVEADIALRGFDVEFEGDIPLGSGMSSSAALECSLAFGLNELFSAGLDDWQLIKICQLAEHK